ncbi:MAG: hypothetical protein COB51_11435 [Moraxellaceae bacterium]|nr:MAG: hypothetical protein COB51_11435 [Moraxellaceae bacterium]
MAAQILIQQVNSPRGNPTAAAGKSDLYGHPVDGGGSDNEDKSHFSSVLKGEMVNESESNGSHSSEQNSAEKVVAEGGAEGEFEESLVEGDMTKIEAELVIEGGGSELPVGEIIEGEELPLMSAEGVELETVVIDSNVQQQVEGSKIDEDLALDTKLSTDDKPLPMHIHAAVHNAENHGDDRLQVEVDEDSDGLDETTAVIKEENNTLFEGNNQAANGEADSVDLKGGPVTDKVATQAPITEGIKTDQQKSQKLEIKQSHQDEAEDSSHAIKAVKTEVIAKSAESQGAQVAVQSARGDEPVHVPLTDKGEKKSIKIDRSSVMADRIVQKGDSFSVLVEEELEVESEFEESNKKGLPLNAQHSKSSSQGDSSQSTKTALPPLQTDLKAASRYKAMEPVPVSTGIKQTVGRPGWSEALSDRVMVFVKERVSMAKIHLEPAQLGPIQVKITMHNDQASVVFVSNNALTRESIESAIPRLREALDQNGINLADVNVQHQEKRERHAARESEFDDKDESELAEGELDGIDAEESGVGETPSSGSSGLVDYYV